MKKTDRPPAKIKTASRLKRLPVLPLPLDKAKRASSIFFGLGEMISDMLPGLPWELEQAEFDLSPREWASIAIFTFIFYFLLLFSTLFVLAIAIHASLSTVLLFSLSIGFVLGFVSFLYVLFYPKLFVSRKVGSLEKNLPYALYHLLVSVHSGIPLYNTLESVAKSKYGMLSDEIQKAVNEINTGKSEIAALELLARKNPSLHFRRVMWQIVNALKSGADIGSTISNIVNDMLADQRIAIKRYGSQLNPMALMYMIFAVIFPTLGITFIIVISSFMGLNFNIEFILMGILGFIVLFQFMIIGLIKSRRPIGI